MTTLRESLMSWAQYAEKDGPLITALIDTVCEQREALKTASSCFSCIRHNSVIDSFLLGLDPGLRITITHIDFSEKLAREALKATDDRLKQWMKHE